MGQDHWPRACWRDVSVLRLIRSHSWLELVNSSCTRKARMLAHHDAHYASELAPGDACMLRASECLSLLSLLEGLCCRGCIICVDLFQIAVLLRSVILTFL